MTPAEMTEVLAACSAYDSRTVGIVDVAAWHKAIGHLDQADALDAVAHHYGTSRDRIMPADINDGCKRIRNERASKRHSEVLAIPSKFELDDIRDDRLRRGVRNVIESIVRKMPSAGGPEDPHAIALVRARRERTQPMPLIVKRKGDGKPIDLSKIPGPEWSKPEVRERASIAALHEVDRPCGRPACPKPACRRLPKDA